MKKISIIILLFIYCNVHSQSVPNTPQLIITCPFDTTITACSDLNTIETSYNNWLSRFSYSGGVNPKDNIHEAPLLVEGMVCGGSISFTYIVESGYGTLQCTSCFTVEQASPLIIDCPSDTILTDSSNLNEIQAAYNSWMAGFTFYGGCNSTDNIGEIPSLDHFTCCGLINFTYIVASDCENVECTSIFAIEPVDTISPIITCPPDVDYEACTVNDIESLTTLPFTTAVSTITLAQFTAAGGSAVDNCAIKEINYRDVSTGICPITITRIFTVIDSCDNSCICQQIINIDDRTPPSLTCPADITFESFTLAELTDITSLSYSSQTDIITYNQLVSAGGMADDNCEIESITYQDTHTESCSLIIIRTFTVTDVCGNTCTCTQIISSEDNIDPKLNCPPDIHISAIDYIPERYYTINEFIDAGGSISDNCSIDSTSFTLISEFMDTIPDPDILKRTYYIADYNMNDDICLHQIILDPATGYRNTYKEDFTFIIYPNPNDGIFILHITGIQSNSVSVYIFDSAGKHIYYKELLMGTNSIYHKINLSEQPNGVYHIKISEGVNVITKSIVIH